MLAMFPASPEGGGSGSSSSSSRVDGSGGGGGSALPSLHAVIVALDGRFITEITHTAALFAQLFPPGGRKRLVKVPPLPPPHLDTLRCWQSLLSSHCTRPARLTCHG